MASSYLTFVADSDSSTRSIGWNQNAMELKMNYNYTGVPLEFLQRKDHNVDSVDDSFITNDKTEQQEVKKRQDEEKLRLGIEALKRAAADGNSDAQKALSEIFGQSLTEAPTSSGEENTPAVEKEETCSESQIM